MKRKVCILFAGLLSGAFAQAQQTADCTPSSSKTDLNINNVRATILGGGDMWWDLNNPQYQVGKGSSGNSPNALFAGALWFSGIDQASNLRTAGQTYRQNGNDFWPGPILKDGSTSKTTCTSFNRHFNVTNEDIQNLKSTGFATNDITFWPAFSEGEALAPFKDVNGNGIYEPELREYPIIKGHQSVYSIFNDLGNKHTAYPNNNAIGIEVRSWAFAYNTSTIAPELISNTTFYEYEIVNKSANTYEDFRVGVFLDYDLGNAADDYIGSDSILKMSFVYNGDNNDEGTFGYGILPPAIGLVEIEADFKTSGVMHFTNGNTQTPQRDPSTAQGVYNFLHNKYNDGTPLTYGGTGYNISSTQYTNYTFSGTSVNSTEWRETGKAGDRRVLHNFSKDGGLLPGEKAILKFCMPFVQVQAASEDAHLQSLALLKDAAVTIQGFVLNSVKNDEAVYYNWIYNSNNKTLNLKGLSQTSCTIYGLNGRVMNTSIIQGDASLDVSKFDNGVYLVQVNNQKAQKFIVY
jgi:hypothetical protein